MKHLSRDTSKYLRINLILIISIFILSSCKKNYITYYKKVNEIDSTYRLADNPKLAIQEYRKLFNEYDPKNQEMIEEFSTYITLSDQYHEDFGGKESLYQLISLVAPYNDSYKKYLPLFKKYGIDNTEVQQKIADWKKDLNQQMVDSFKIAFTRDQLGRPNDTVLVRKNIEKNARLFKWTFENIGFPSKDKIGDAPMLTLVSHMGSSNTLYPYLETKILEYVKSGDCPPLDYSMMVDSHKFSPGKTTQYGMGRSFMEQIDTAAIDRHRKSIGLASLKHSAAIKKDFLKKLKMENANVMTE